MQKSQMRPVKPSLATLFIPNVYHCRDSTNLDYNVITCGHLDTATVKTENRQAILHLQKHISVETTTQNPAVSRKVFPEGSTDPRNLHENALAMRVEKVAIYPHWHGVRR